MKPRHIKICGMAVNVVLRRKFLALNTYISGKEKRSHINDSASTLKKLEKNKSKLNPK